jgi:DNA-binding LytR/AlgR family response regulator
MAGLCVAICEDDVMDAMALLALVESCEPGVHAEVFSSGEEFLASYGAGKYHVVFLDIYLQGLSGLEAARQIRMTDSTAVLAFCTNSAEHTLESYSLSAIKYLLKPVQAAAVQEVLEWARIRREVRPAVQVLSGGTSTRLPLEEICFFEKSAHDIVAYTCTGAVRLSRQEDMDGLIARLPSPPFLRCHRSYIVNFEHVASLGNDFKMSDGRMAYVRQKDLVRVRQAWEDWVLGCTQR